MKSSLFTLFVAVIVPVVFGSCKKSAAVPDKAVLFQVLEDNARAWEKKDLDAVMATIHPQAPSFAETREVMTETFKAVDVKCTLSDLRVVTAASDEARVSFVQKTERVAGEPLFPGNIVQGIHTLRPDHGKWKIYRTLQTSVTGLDGQPITEPPPDPDSPPTPSAAAAPPAEPAPKPPTPAEGPTP